MPTLEHNAFVDMFRENPELAPHFLGLLLHIDVPPHTSAAVVESSLDQLVPVEFRADLVIELRDARSALVLAIVLEVQRHEDPDKRYSRAVYVAVVRARKRCPTMMLVVATDAAVAKWAGQTIDLGLGLASLRPIVLGPASVPEVTDPAAAERDAELAVLSAIAHGDGPNGLAVLRAAVVALDRLDPEHAGVYFQIIYDALREPMQRALEVLAMERQSEGDTPYHRFMQRVERKCFEDGERKGFGDGERKGLRDALLRVITRAGIALTEDERGRIQACDDAATLDRWIDNVLGAKTAADVLS